MLVHISSVYSGGVLGDGFVCFCGGYVRRRWWTLLLLPWALWMVMTFGWTQLEALTLVLIIISLFHVLLLEFTGSPPFGVVFMGSLGLFGMSDGKHEWVNTR